LDKFKPIYRVNPKTKQGQRNIEKEVNRLKKYLPIIFTTFEKRINYKHNSLKSSEIKFIDKNFQSYSPENYSKLLEYTLDSKKRLPAKFFANMITGKDMDKVMSTPITEAEFTVDQYNLFDFMTNLTDTLWDIKKFFFPNKSDEEKDHDLDQKDKNEFDQLYNKYLNIKEKDREKQFDSFKNELKNLILSKLEKLKEMHLKVLEDTKTRFTDDNIKKYLVHKMYNLK
jgi:hypothetical protein